MSDVLDHADRYAVATVLDAARVDPQRGLTADEAQRRLATEGRNELPRPAPQSFALQVTGQLREPMALLLIGAACVSGIVLGEVVDAVAIGVIVVLNATIAIVEERRAASALAALQALEVPRARVRRDGVVWEVPSAELVTGDILLLDAGDRVPADVRLVETVGLEVDESLLTGESLAVRKDAGDVTPRDAGLGDRTGFAHTGTFVTRGTATGVAVATGPDTTLATIARQVSAAPRPTPLQIDLAHVTRQLAYVSIAVAAAVLALSLVRAGLGAASFEQAFLAAVALAVAAVPEGLATVTAVGLALGVRRMAERGAIVRRLAAVETLGSVTVLMVDKTGTLTENRMSVAEYRSATGAAMPLEQWEPHERELAEAVMALCNDATLDPPVGDPMEIALLEAVGAATVRRLRSRWPRRSVSPFDAERRRMATVNADATSSLRGFELLVKGAPETVLPQCATVPSGRPFDSAHAGALHQAIEAMTATGVRVLALARRRLEVLPEDPDAEVSDLQLVGLVGLRDPVRRAAADSVSQARSAGITLLMVTGDHPGTARAVAGEVGMVGGDGGPITTGRQLRTDGLSEDPATTTVYARVDPEQKLAVVERLQERGEVVGMTGDGVNDAPALRQADIGIALGRRGSDVAREAAAMIITDDDLATIVSAVREGRGIYDNLRKVVDYLVAGNLGEIFVVVTGLLLVPAMGLPLLPLQLLWINLVTDGLPAIALGVDTTDPGVMDRPPRDVRARLLTWGRIRLLSGRAFVIAASALGGLAVARLALDASWAQARTVLFSALVIAHLGYAYVVRRGSGGLTSNPWLLLATAGGIALQVLLVLVPATRELFDVVPLSVAGWAIVVVAAVVPNVVLWTIGVGGARERSRSAA